jgi:rsbT co-antagonist protein RsbR
MIHQSQKYQSWEEERADLHRYIAALRHERDTIYKLLDALPVLVYHYDVVKQCPLYRNREVVDVLGYSAEEIEALGNGILPTLMHPDDLARHQHYMETLFQTTSHGITEFEYRMRHKDGTWRWFQSCDVVFARAADGTPQQIVGSAHDITERKQQEEELRLFKLIVERATDAIGFTDMQGNIIYSNPAHRALFGYGEEILGMPISITVAPEGAALLEAGIQEVFVHGTWRGESINKHKDGTTFPVEVAVFPMQNSAGDYQGVVGFLHDITERKAQEAERQALQQRIIAGQQSIIHELSTPILPITDDVLVMPLVGSIDSARAQLVMETLLEGVAHHHATLVILDITGVQVVDTQVANAFLQAAQAVQLLGAQVMITGIQPAIAQTLVQLGVDLQHIRTQSTLQAGIAHVLRNRERKIR